MPPGAVRFLRLLAGVPLQRVVAAGLRVLDLAVLHQDDLSLPCALRIEPEQPPTATTCATNRSRRAEKGAR